MALNKAQFKELIEETLEEIGLCSTDAVNLLLGTAAQESGFGTYIEQLGNGPALGVFQMEPNTFKDHIANYLKYKKGLISKIKQSSNVDFFTPGLLKYNLKFAICMARIHYLRVPSAIPTDLSGYAKYWKDYYNTYLGAGTEEEFIHNYKKHVL
jgi:hypothetical protein